MSRLFKYAIVALIVVLTVAALARADVLLHRRQQASTPLTEMTVVWTGYGAGETMSIPGYPEPGDIAILCDRVQQGTEYATTVVPTGWTSIANNEVTWFTYAKQILSYKVLTAADISTGTVTGMTDNGVGNYHTRKVMFVFHGDGPVVTATVEDSAGEALPFAAPATQQMDYGGSYPFVTVGCASGNAIPDSTITWATWTLPSPYTTQDTLTNINMRGYFKNSTVTSYQLRMTDPGERNITQSVLITVE